MSFWSIFPSLAYPFRSRGTIQANKIKFLFSPIEDLLEPLEIIVYNSDQWNKSKSIIGKVMIKLNLFYN